MYDCLINSDFKHTRLGSSPRTREIDADGIARCCLKVNANETLYVSHDAVLCHDLAVSDKLDLKISHELGRNADDLLLLSGGREIGRAHV